MVKRIFTIIEFSIGLALVIITSIILIFGFNEVINYYYSDIFDKILYIGLFIIFAVIVLIFTFLGIYLMRNAVSRHKEKKYQMHMQKYMQDLHTRQMKFLSDRGFKISRYFDTCPRFLIDDNKNRFAVVKNDSMPNLYSYKDILNYSLINNSHYSYSSFEGRTICSHLGVRITLNNIYNPSLIISFISQPIDKNSEDYRTRYEEAEKFLSVLSYIKNKAKNCITN